MAVIENNTRVEMAYTLRDEVGAVLDASEAGRPFTYVQGQNEILPALEEALVRILQVVPQP